VNESDAWASNIPVFWLATHLGPPCWTEKLKHHYQANTHPPTPRFSTRRQCTQRPQGRPSLATCIPAAVDVSSSCRSPMVHAAKEKQPTQAPIRGGRIE